MRKNAGLSVFFPSPASGPPPSQTQPLPCHLISITVPVPTAATSVFFTGAEKYRFSVAFYAESVLWVKERKWAADQIIQENDDGVTITFTSTQYDKVLGWVLSHGCRALPLEPERLVKDWKWHATGMRRTARHG
jgi:hypothetical protein